MKATAGVRAAFLAVAISAVSAAAGAGQGWIEPGVERGGFAVDRTRSEVLVRIEGRVAQIEVSEWFVNRGRRMAEGDYIYPLPGEAVFQGFSLFQGDAELRGEIMDAERARHIYEEIVRRRADPALIELAGHGLLRARIFPIQPDQVVTSARSAEPTAAPAVSRQRAAADETRREEDSVSLVVPGLEVLDVLPVGQGTTFAGMRALQRLESGDTLELVHLPEGIDPSFLPPLSPGQNQLVLQRGAGWLVMRARVPEPYLQELLQRLEAGH